MKKDRNCNMYPTYPMPYMGVNQMMPYIPMPYMDNMNTNPGNSDYNNLSNQISSLERRISNLEAIVGNNNYNNSTYQMM